MQIALLIFQLVPTIVKLVSLAEELYSDKPQSGAEKKDFVMRTVEALSIGASTIFTGGAADTWGRIRTPISIIIDAAATIAFPNKISPPDAG